MGVNQPGKKVGEYEECGDKRENQSEVREGE
jgi:hypothetical protein